MLKSHRERSICVTVFLIDWLPNTFGFWRTHLGFKDEHTQFLPNTYTALSHTLANYNL